MQGICQPRVKKKGLLNFNVELMLLSLSPPLGKKSDSESEEEVKIGLSFSHFPLTFTKGSNVQCVLSMNLLFTATSFNLYIMHEEIQAE